MTDRFDRSLIGTRSEPEVFEVERGAIRKFSDAVGMAQPEYLRGDIAPPTFPTTFRSQKPVLRYNPAGVLHGGQEFDYVHPLRAGDVLTCTSTVVDIVDKETRLGPMQVITVEMRGDDARGQPVFTARSTILLRQEGAR